MDPEPQFFAERHRYMLLLTAVWTMSGVVLYLVVPLTAPALLPLCALAPVTWYVAAERSMPLYKPSTVLVGLALAGIYLLINASWSLSPSTAYFALAFFFLFIASLHFTLNTLHDIDGAPLRAMAIGFYAALAIGGAVVCIEVFSEQWLRRQLMIYAPSFRPEARFMIVEAGLVKYLPPYLLNRSITALAVLFWPAVLLVVSLARSSRSGASPSGVTRSSTWLALALLPVAAAIFRSEHATSKIAFVGAATTFGLFQVSPALTKRAITLSWVGVIVLVVPLAILAYHSQLYLAPWLPVSAQHRIVIWGHTSHQIASAPLLGAGIHTARALNDPYSLDMPVAPGTEFRLTTGLHSHNGYLQTWYEAGAVGAMFLLGIGLLMLQSLARAPPHVQPYMHAAFVACALMGASSFSLWQPWFMASLGFAAVFGTLGWALASRDAADAALSAPGDAGS
jgi:hypothetical protein